MFTSKENTKINNRIKKLEKNANLNMVISYGLIDFLNKEMEWLYRERKNVRALLVKQKKLKA